MKRLAVTAVVILGLAAVCHSPVHAAPAPPTHSVVCIVFEDDSFMCGTPLPGGWLDRTHPFITGCIPEGLCDSRDDPSDTP